MPRHRAAALVRVGAACLRVFVEDVKASGLVADAIRRAGQCAAVAPPAGEVARELRAPGNDGGTTSRA
jgi:hypothetical protein